MFGVLPAASRMSSASTVLVWAVERVRAHIDAARFACELRNPRGACCLGDAIAAVKRVESTVTAQSLSGPAAGEFVP